MTEELISKESGYDQDGIVISEDDNYGSKGEGYSYPSLVMTILRKAIEVGSMEMKEGYFNYRFDKNGNAHKVWIPDQRDAFLQTIATLKSVLEREYDEDTEKEMKKLNEDLEEFYLKCVKEEEYFWDKINSNVKKYWQIKGAFYNKGSLSKKLPFYQEFVNYSVKISRKEFTLCLKLIKKRQDFKDEGVTG